MKLIQKFVNEQTAKAASLFMRFVCYLVIVFSLVCLVLSFMGRQTFTLRTREDTYEHAIYAEENHEPHSRGLTVSMGDYIRVKSNTDNEIDFTTHIGLSLMFAAHVVPMIFATWFLSRVFTNVYKGRIFTEQNAKHLLYYGLLQFFTAIFVPFLKLLICYLTNLVSRSQIIMSTGQNMFNLMVPSIAFLVAAYIIHHGIHLQDEVDHTL